MRKPSAVGVLRLAIFLGLIAAAVIGTDPALLAGFLNSKLLLALLLIQPFVLGSILMTSMRYAALVGPGTPVGPAFKAVMLSSGLNSILPGRIAEVIKPTYLRDHGNVPLSTGMSAVFLERVIDLVFLALFGLIGAQLLAFKASYLSVATAVAAIAAVWLAIRFRAVFFRAVERIPWPAVQTFLTRCLSQISVGADRTLLFKCGLYTCGVWALSYLCVVIFIAMAGRIDIGLVGSLAVLLAATAGGAIPIMPAGLGTFEAAVVFVLQRYGYAFEESLAVAFGLHMAFILPNVIGAFIIAAFERTGIAALIRQLWRVWRTGGQ
jgi:uncharacterized membrane protein YbhN (UPF0104 family)